jgi:hypothetical protein
MCRFAVVLLATLLAGCVSTPIVGPEFNGAAFLEYVGDTSLGPGDGIYMIDGHALDRPPQKEVYIRPGRREVAFNCPGWLSVDGLPSTAYTFKAGGRYGLFCSSGSPAVQIRSL